MPDVDREQRIQTAPTIPDFLQPENASYLAELMEDIKEAISSRLDALMHPSYPSPEDEDAYNHRPNYAELGEELEMAISFPLLFIQNLQVGEDGMINKYNLRSHHLRAVSNTYLSQEQAQTMIDTAISSLGLTKQNLTDQVRTLKAQYQ